MKNRTAWLVVAGLVALALVLGGVMWVMSNSNAAEDPLTNLEQQNAELASRVDSLTAQVASANAAAEVAAASAPTPTPTAPATTPPSTPKPKPKPSFVTYAYVKKLTGPYNETFTVYIDPFEILTGSAAINYANAHGQVPPSNGILLVNSSTKTSAYPLAEMAKITANVGSVEDPTYVPVEPGHLQSWASDHSVIPGAISDMWQVTVKNGVITTIKMMTIAD